MRGDPTICLIRPPAVESFRFATTSIALPLGLAYIAAALKAADLSVGFYRALPGTELFHSLYDAGRIKLDRRYFRHILESLAFVPSQRYCDALRPVDLVRWKFKLYRRFYGATKRKSQGGLLASVQRAVGGLFGSGEHTTKLQSAFRNALASGLDTVRVVFQPRYMSEADKREMFASWDAIYRRVREQNLASGVVLRAPADTAELQRTNVIAALTREHGTPHAIGAAR